METLGNECPIIMNSFGYPFNNNDGAQAFSVDPPSHLVQVLLAHFTEHLSAGSY